MVNLFCSKRKEPRYSSSQISLPVLINMEELTHNHPIFKKNIFQTKNSKMCPSREDKGISLSLETADERSTVLVFSTRLPNSSSNGTSTGEGSKGTKSKSGTTKTRSRSEGNTGKRLHFKSLPLKKGIFAQFFLISKG